MTRRSLYRLFAVRQLAVGLATLGVTIGMAQESTGAARRATARLEERVQNAMQLLTQARQLYADGKYAEALDTYRKSLATLPDTPTTAKRKQFLELSIADASVAVAQEYLKVGRYDEATGLLNEALKLAPDHKLAKHVLTLAQDTVRHNPALTPQHVQHVDEVNRLLHLAYGYYELGQYDEATKNFQAVLRIDPYNVAARRGMELVNRARTNYYAAAYDEARGNAMAEVDRMWEQPVVPEDMPDVPEFFSKPLDAQPANVAAKLGLIKLPKVRFDDVTVQEAVEYLRRQAIAHDTTALNEADKGVNISIEVPGGADNLPHVSLNLENVPLREALNYVARAAGLVLRTNAYGAQLMSRDSGAAVGAMVTRTVPLPAGFFTAMATNTGASDEEADPFAGDEGGSGLKVKRIEPEKLLKAQGLKLPQGSMVAFNPRNSSLLFRGTHEDFALLEDLVAANSAQQPVQVVVSATFLEVNQKDLEDLGFNWILDLTLDPRRWFMGGAGTHKGGYNSTVIESAAQIPEGVPPINVVGQVRSGDQAFGMDNADKIDAILETGDLRGFIETRKGSPSILTLRGIWNNTNLTMIMRGLSQKKGTDIVQHPSVIVKPGETASFFSGHEMTYPTEYEPPELPNNVGNGNNNRGFGLAQVESMPVTPAHPGVFEMRRIGTAFEVEVASISEDKSVVELNIKPEIVDFDGFINYGSPITMPATTINTQTGDPMVVTQTVSNNMILQPVFSVKRIETSVHVATGHTLVVGTLRKSNTITYEDKIPLLGDLPLVGRLFRSQGTKEQKKALIIMVKAEIVDPGGKPLYTPGMTNDTTEPELTAAP